MTTFGENAALNVIGGVAGGATAAIVGKGMTALLDLLGQGTTFDFAVELDGESIGHFDSCSGLGVTLEYEEVHEGGNNTMVWQLPKGLRYGEITLKRPVNFNSLTTIKWLTKCAQSGLKRKTGVITMLSSDYGIKAPVARWSLNDVVPVSWSGPDLSMDGGKVATETLKLRHHGFADDYVPSPSDLVRAVGV